ncbi:MAG: GNAT family N-acetyltransferase [Rhodocyclaceae bacterium]|nr:GNAT family N-acetyltransferase [Rhodocyclaceae bacterium]
MREDWNALAADRSVFLRHEWFDAAWQWRKHEDATHLSILCAYNGTHLAGIFPLLRKTERAGGMSRRVLEFLTVPDNQLCDIIVDAPDEFAVAEAMAAELAARSGTWDVMHLAYLPEGSMTATGAFTNALKRLGITHRLRSSGSNSYVSLETGWNDYYAKRGRSLKKTINLAANRLKKAGETQIEWLASNMDSSISIDAVIDAAIGVSAASWKRTTGNSLDNPGPQAFIRRLAELALVEGWLSLWLMKLDGKPIATEWQLIFGDRVHALRSDFVEAYDDLSPGTHLNKHLLESLFDRGLQRYLMGPGDNPYKKRWSELAEPLFQLDAYSPSLRGRFAAAWDLKLKPRLRTLKAKMNRNQEGGSP